MGVCSCFMAENIFFIQWGKLSKNLLPINSENHQHLTRAHMLLLSELTKTLTEKIYALCTRLLL